MNSRDFLLGQSYIGTGENMKAVERFVKASEGVDTGKCTCINNIHVHVPWDLSIKGIHKYK